VIEEIIQRHLLQGEIVEEYAIAQHPLPDRTGSPAPPSV
jgi:(2Fe-2S) ferredoxin